MVSITPGGVTLHYTTLDYNTLDYTLAPQLNKREEKRTEEAYVNRNTKSKYIYMAKNSSVLSCLVPYLYSLVSVYLLHVLVESWQHKTSAVALGLHVSLIIGERVPSGVFY